MTRFPHWRLERLLAAVALLAVAGAWVAWWRLDLVLSHYDAKAHLVVARRIVDSLTPGWKQIGAVWLPLPHLLNLLPTQIDLFYRTGAFASGLSMGCFTVTVWASARAVRLLTGSTLGAATTGVLLIVNPSLLYIHATPMTEPLLLAVLAVAVGWTIEWIAAADERVPWRLGAIYAAAVLTRYEAWPVIACLLAASVVASVAASGLGRRPVRRAVTRTVRLGAWPAIAIAAFLVNSRLTIGDWFVTGGFYVPHPGYLHQPVKTLIGIWWGTHQMSSYAMAAAALVTAAVVVIRTFRSVAGIAARNAVDENTSSSTRSTWSGSVQRSRQDDWSGMERARREALVVPLALFAAAALPFYAFVSGHPYRIRYMVPVVATSTLFAGLGVALLDQGARRRPILASMLAILLVASSLIQSPPWRLATPLTEEARWDEPYRAGRRAVTACLARSYDDDTILASMGSLAHYIQELSAIDIDIADVLHEGNGALWELALADGPARYAGWMLIEERAEGGDLLAMRLRDDDAFARGMRRVCEGGGVALYQRTPRNMNQHSGDRDAR